VYETHLCADTAEDVAVVATLAEDWMRSLHVASILLRGILSSLAILSWDFLVD
jgi:hypothetical protein